MSKSRFTEAQTIGMNRDDRSRCQMALKGCPAACQHSDGDERAAPVTTEGRPEALEEHVAA